MKIKANLTKPEMQLLYELLAAQSSAWEQHGIFGSTMRLWQVFGRRLQGTLYVSVYQPHPASILKPKDWANLCLMINLAPHVQKKIIGREVSAGHSCDLYHKIAGPVAKHLVSRGCTLEAIQDMAKYA